jgi:hypothetical protein
VRRELAGGKRPDGHRRLRIRYRPDPARLHVRPTEEPLTGVAGLVPFGAFLQRLGVDRELHAAFDPLKSGVRMVYRVGDVLRLLIDGLVLGETRVYPIEVLAADALFARLAGGMVPSVDVLYDDLRRFTDEDRRRLCAMLVTHGFALVQKARPKVIHLDLDTTVEPLFGEQIEGARKGPNPRYRGRVSYHPIVARVAEVNAVVGARLRPGDTGFGNDDVPWLRAVIEALREAVGPDVVIVVRIDAAGDAVEVLKAIDQLGCLFVIKARMSRDLCDAIVLRPERAWRTVDRDADGRPTRQVTAVADFTRQVWARQAVRYDVIAVRERDKTGGRKLYLWADDEWTAHAFVTNALDWEEDEIAREYAPRAGIEPMIGEFKHGYGMGQVPTGDFGANEVMFLLKLLTYNLVQRFVRAHHPSLASWQIGWLRRVLFRVPGRLIRHARQTTLLVPFGSRMVLLN